MSTWYAMRRRKPNPYHVYLHVPYYVRHERTAAVYVAELRRQDSGKLVWFSTHVDAPFIYATLDEVSHFAPVPPMPPVAHMATCNVYPERECVKI